MFKRLWDTTSLEKMLGCDLRSLALLRVSIAFILLLDLLNKTSNFTAFLSEFGLFPRKALLELYGSFYIWSVNHVATGDWWQALLLGFNYLSVLLLFVGYRTRLTTIVCWILQISLQAKNPILMQSGDVLLRNILFWGMFLPWGAVYSVDSALSSATKPKRIFNYATIGLCLQALYVYFFGVFLKTGAQWRVDGTAVYYALNIDHFSTPLGRWLLTFPIDFLRVMNFSVLAFEFIGPILLLLPWWHKWLRPILILSFWFMHLSFGATLAIGNFVLISMASTIPFIPTETWDWLSKKFAFKKIGTIYYDQDCGFCIKMVAIVREFLFLPNHIFKPAQSDLKIEKLMLTEDTWVFESVDKKNFMRAAALREAFALSPVFFWLKWFFKIPGLLVLGDLLYQRIAAHRARTCDSLDPPIKKVSPVFELKTWENYFLSFVVVFVALWNVGTMPGSRIRVAQNFEPFALIFRFDQKWEMFAPYPLTDDGWFIVKAQLRNNEVVDALRNGAAVTYDKPQSVKDMYKDFRWRKYMVNLWARVYSPYRQYYSRYLCREWNSSHKSEEQIGSFDLIYMREDTPAPGVPLPKPVEMNIWNWKCF